MSKASTALIGPSGLPPLKTENRWCPSTLREKAWQGWRAKGLPAKGVEDYLYMDWKRLESVELAQPDGEPVVVERAESAQISFQSAAGVELCSGKGVEVSLLSEASESTQDAVASQLTRLVDSAEHGIDLLRVALLRDAVLVEVAAESSAALTLSLAHNATKSIAAPLVVIRVGKRAKLSIEDRISGEGDEPSLALPLTLIDVEESASVEQVVLSAGSLGRHVLRRQETSIHKSARFAGFVLATSGALSREGHVLSLKGEGAHAELHGLYLSRPGAYTDIWTRIEHLEPHTTSRSMFKGIVAERAEATFNGYVYVERDAQKTDSSLYNKNLLLSKRARANTRPQLEIYADDVKCAHGSTIGQLNENQLFYLMTRGLPEAQARAMLVDAFGREVIEDCPLPALKDNLDTAISTTIASMVEGV